MSQRSPHETRLRILRVAKLVTVINSAVILGVLAGIVLLNMRDEEGTLGHDGFRGSKPPSGQKMPHLEELPGVPPRSELVGKRTLVVGTCMDCASGDILGSAVARLFERDFPEDAQLVMITWQGNLDEFRNEWRIPNTVQIYAMPDEQSRVKAQEMLRIGESGYSYLFDSKGTWRSSYPAQLLLPADVLHDLKQIK